MTVTTDDMLIILDNELLPSFNKGDVCYLCKREIQKHEHVLDLCTGVLCSSCTRAAAHRLDYLNTYGETN